MRGWMPLDEEPPVGGRSALHRLWTVAESLKADFTADTGAALSPVVVEALSEGDILLTEMVVSFGWDGQRFARPVNCQAFISRLKALMYDGLELKGEGSYATVYKVRDRMDRGAIAGRQNAAERYF